MVAFLFLSQAKLNTSFCSCSRPTALQERTRDSDEDELHDRDYDVAGLTNNLSPAFRYNVYGSEDVDEVFIQYFASILFGYSSSHKLQILFSILCLLCGYCYCTDYRFMVHLSEMMRYTTLYCSTRSYIPSFYFILFYESIHFFVHACMCKLIHSIKNK